MLTSAQKIDNRGAIPALDDEKQFVLEDYDSEGEKKPKNGPSDLVHGDYISAANLALMDKSVDPHDFFDFFRYVYFD